MSILIKGVKMPTSCLKGCPLDGIACELWEDKYWASYEDPEKGRHRDCPLIELPDHGRLKDADSISEKIDNIWDGRPLSMLGCEILAIIDKEPTVIPAERSGE